MRKRTSKTPRIVLTHSESQRLGATLTIVEAILKLSEIEGKSAAGMVREIIFFSPSFIQKCKENGLEVLP